LNIPKYFLLLLVHHCKILQSYLTWVVNHCD
jgi:hypothetical protein